jgi:hypothetical protein
MKFGDWTPFSPIKEMESGGYDIDSYTENFDGLIINLHKRKNSTKKLLIIFTTRVISRIMNESYRMSLDCVHANCPPIPHNCGPLFTVEDSEYMKYLSEISSSMTDLCGFKHYYVEDGEWSFDIASRSLPKIELFINDKLIETYNPLATEEPEL